MYSTKCKPGNRENRQARKARHGFRAAGRFGRGLSLEPLEKRVLLSVTPKLIDLNAAGASSPSDFVQVGQLVFFTAEDDAHGRELWVTDGTADGTELFKDINAGSASSDPRELTEVNGTLFFVANDGANGEDLWKTDGTYAGTVMVKDVNPGDLTNVNGTLFFSAEDADHGTELWMSDGTTVGTAMVKDIFEGTYTKEHGTYPLSSNPLNLVNVGGTLFFTAYDHTSGRELWKSDGTADGTALVKDIFQGTYPYYSDDVYQGQHPNSSDPDSLTAVDGMLFFTAKDEEHGRELWVWDGAKATLVEDILEGATDGFTEDDSLVNSNGTLFFTANNGYTGHELWKLEDLQSGVELVKDIYPGGEWYQGYVNGYYYDGYRPYTSSPQDFTVLDGLLFFSAADEEHGRELWMTDGTGSGTEMVKDVYPGTSYDSSTSSYVPNSSNPRYLTAVDGRLFFAADDETYGRELWTCDAGTADTVLVYDIVSASDGSSPQSLFSYDSRLLFSADDGQAGRELWVLEEYGEQSEIEAHLSIFIDGEQVTIPKDIGVDEDGNISPIYTIDAAGTLNTSAVDDQSLPDDITLDDFFETWRTNAGLAGNNAEAVFNESQILGHSVDDEYMIQMFVNGQADRHFDEYVIQDGDEIVIAYTSNEVVSLNTNLGSVLIELYEDETPITVDNFLNYVNDGDYIDSFFHRSDPDFVIQAGGYTTPYLHFYGTYQFGDVPTDPAIQNEPGISNLEGTVAMAKLLGDPNSATSQFFVNLGDNVKLDTEEYGRFTVFGRVLGMTTVEAIEALDVDYANDPPFNELPLTDERDLVVIESIGGEGDLSGTSFEDLDCDGEQGSAESGLEGVVVFADANDNGVLDEGEYSTTTDSNGDWLLRLPAGTHIVCQEATDGLFPTTGEGTAVHTVTVQIGREIEDLDFANIDNGPPQGTADAYTVNEDDTLTIGAGDGVLANDSDPEDDSLTAVLVENAAHGDVSLAGDGSFTYTPDADYYGTDTFTYRAQDHYSQSTTVTVTITVESQPDYPTAVNDQFTVSKDSTTQSLDVLDNDYTDPDGTQSLSIISVTPGSKGGTVSVSSDALQVEYTPPSGYSGTETFTYTVEDSDKLTDTATVTVTVDESQASEALGSISGYVYCDSDNDGQRDSRELGVQGSLVTLTGVDDHGNSVSKSMLTLRDGSYRFDGLAPGTYEVTQQQPEALLDGKDTIGTLGGTVSDDHFSKIVLGEGDHSSENNFGELGLRPRFITLGLFLASMPPIEEYLPELMAYAEELAGNTDLAQWIRNEIENPPEKAEDLPDARNDSYSAGENDVLTVDATEGVLVNDVDENGNPINVPSGLVITEINYNPYDPTDAELLLDSTLVADDFEFIELANVSDVVIDLTGVRFTAGITFNFNAGDVLELAPGETVLVVSNQDAFETRYGTALNVAGEYSGTLSDSGEQITLEDALSQPIQQFTYDDGDDWPDTTDGDTLDVIDVTGNYSDADNWTAGGYGGTPGVADNAGDVAVFVPQLVDSPSNGNLIFSTDGSFTYTPDTDFYGTDTFTYLLTDGELESEKATVTITVNASDENEAPLAEDDAYRVDEDETLTVNARDGVLDNDSDPDGDDIQATIYSYASNGTVSLLADGSFVYTPEADFYGIDSFQYTVDDGSLDSSPATVTITVDPVNDAPVAEDDAYQLSTDDALHVDADSGVLANDTDVEDDDLTASVVATTAHGALDLDGDGSFTYTPNSGFHGEDSFTYRVYDGSDYSDEATVTLTVNDPPEATDDAYTIEEDGVLSKDAQAGVLANDTDTNDDSLTATVVSQPSHGTLVLNGDGSFDYTPGPNFNGTDTFTYKADDGFTDSGTATVTITVEAVNDAPVAVDDKYSVNEDETLDVDADWGVLANDSDVDNDDELSVAVVKHPAHGSLTLLGDGSFTYVPEQGFVGTDTFTYTANDGELDSEAATVSITVVSQTLPTAVDDEYQVAQETTLTVSEEDGLLANDLNLEDAYIPAIVDGPSSGTLDYLADDGSFAYTPNADFAGIVTFTYKLTDGTNESNVATVTIAVGQFEAADDAYEVDRNEELIVPAGDGVLANDVGVGDTAVVELVGGVSSGTLDLALDGSFTYMPNEDFTGTDSFTYKMVDGETESNVATVTITVTEETENDPPVAVDDEYDVLEDEVLEVGMENGVRENDYDVDGSPATPLTSLVITEINYNPYDPDEADEDEAEYDNDDFEFIELMNVGDATIDLAGVRFTEGVSFDFTDGSVTELAPGETVLLVSNLSAFEARCGDGLNVAGEYGSGEEGGLANGGERIVLEDASGETIQEFTYQDANGWPTEPDGNGPTLEVLDVTGDYDDPTNWAASEDVGGTPGTAQEFSVEVPDALLVTVVDQPENGELLMNDDGSFVYEPDDDFSGVDTFTYRLNDGGLDSNVATVTINVEGENDPPAVEDDEYSTDEDEPLEVDAEHGVLANDEDPDGSPASALTCLVITEINYNPHDATDAERAINDDFDSDDFEFIELENAGDATIDLAGVAFTDGIVFDFTGSDVTELAPGETVLVVANREAFEARYGDELNVAGEFGSSALNNGGERIVLVDSFGSTIHDFTYDDADGWPALADGRGYTLEVVDVTGDYGDLTNWLASDERGGSPGTGAGHCVDRDALVAVLVDAPENGDLEFNSDGSFTYTPHEGFGGTDTFTYRASDGTAQSSLVTVTIHIAPQNDPPETEADVYETDEDGTLEVEENEGVLANDEDPDGSPATPLTSLVITEINYNPYDATDEELEVDENLDNDDFEFIELENVSDQIIDLAGVRFTAGVTFDFSDGEVLELAPGETVLVVGNLSAFEIRYGGELNVAGEFAGSLNNGGETIRLADGDDNTIQEFTYHDTGDWPLKPDGQGPTLEVIQVFADYNEPGNWIASEDDGGTPGTGTGQTVDVPNVLTAVLVQGPSHGDVDLNQDGSFTYTPDAEFSGTDTFYYRASDGSAESDPVEVTIIVNLVNDAPVASDDPDYTTPQDTKLEVGNDNDVLENDYDPDGSPGTPLNSLVITEINYNPHEPTQEELNQDGSLDNDDFEFIELENVGDKPIDLTGVYFADGVSFDFTGSAVTQLAPGETVLVVRDTAAFAIRYGTETAERIAGEFSGGLENGGETISLKDADDETIQEFTYGNQDPWPTTPDGQGYTLEVVDVEDDYDDPANWLASADVGGTPGTGTGQTVAVDILMAELVEGPQHGDLILYDDGSFEYTPEEGYLGQDTFTYKATDGADDSNEATVTITVTQ